MSDSNDKDMRVLRETLERVDAIRKHPDIKTRNETVQWLLESKEHAACFAEQHEINEAIRRTVRAREQRELASRRFPFSLVMRLALVPTLVVATLLLWWNVLSWNTAKAAVADIKPMALPDGSTARRYADCILKVRMIGHIREVRLLQGGASFQVAHDASRPFQVRVDDIVVEAEGTGFNVLRKGDITGIYVSSRTVVVSSPSQKVRLAAGESLDVLKNGHMSEVRKPPSGPDRADQDVPLGRLVDEVNRHNMSPQIYLASGAENLSFKNSLSLDDAEAWARILRGYDKVDVKTRGRDITVSAK